MKTLHLNLKKKWFDMIYKGNKPKEYRKISPHWCSRFLLCNGKRKNSKFWENLYLFCGNVIIEHSLIELKKHIESGFVSFENYDTVIFSNGMTPPVPRFEIDLIKFEIGMGEEDHGAINGVEYFVLSLCEIIRKDNVR